MSERHRSQRFRTARWRVLVVVLVVGASLASTAPAWAFPGAPGEPAAGDASLPCQPVNPFCAVGQAAGAAVTGVWTSAMFSLWGAGLWLLGLAFSVVDELTTPDLSADGPLAGIYPVTFGIGALVATVTGLTQLGAAALRRDGRTLGRLLVGLVQFEIGRASCRERV